MRLPSAVIVSAALALAIVGCSATPSTSSTPGTTLAPGTTATAGGATPAPTVPSGVTQPPIAGTGHECDAVPTFSISNPDPATPPPDTALLAHFPATIDGQPVTELQSMQWIYLLCAFGGQEAYNQTAATSGGLNFASMSFATANATVDDEEVSLTAFRTPGQDGNTLIQALATLAAAAGTDINPGNVTPANISGKNVYIWTDTDGAKSYAYVSGDTLIVFDGVTDSQASKILAALP